MIPPYRKNNTLAVALSANESSPMERPSLPPPRFLEVKNAELPADAKPGDMVCLQVYAIVKSMNDEERSLINVVQISADLQDQKEIRVITQESHA